MAGLYLGDLEVIGLDGTIGGGSSSADPVVRLRSELAKSPTQPVRLVFTGSSTTAGNNATTAANRYVNRLVASAQAAYPNGGTEAATQASTSAGFTPSSSAGIQGFNAGEGGTTSNNYLTTAEINAIAALAPVAVQHMVMANDYSGGINPATAKANVLAKTDALQAARPGVVQVFVHSYPRQDVTSPAYPWADYGKALAEIAAADPANRIFVDLSQSYAPIGVPGSDPANVLDTDNIHQTNAGHALMAELLRVALGIPGPTAFTGPADTTAPTVPTGLTVGTVTASSVALSWTASTDAVGVVGYRVRRGGALVGTPGGTSFTDTGLAASTSYSYTVSAVDAAGNESAQTAPVSATTPVAAPLVADNFNRPDGNLAGSTTSTGGQAWSCVVGQAGGAAPATDVVVASGTVGPKSGGFTTAMVLAEVDMGVTNYTVEATLTGIGTAASARGGGLACRMSAAGGAYFLSTRVNATTQGWALYYQPSTAEGGGLSLKAQNTTVTPTVGDRVRLVVSGTTITAFVNEAQILQFTSATANQTSPLAGFAFTTAGAGTRFDDFARTA